MNMPFDRTFAGKPKPVPNAALVCLACGMSTTAMCGCGAPLVRPGERAAHAIKAHPELSNTVLAERLGVDESTVRRARKTLYASSAFAELRHTTPTIIERDGRERVAVNKKKPVLKLFKRRKVSGRYKKPVTEQDQLIAFTRELAQFAMQFSLELTQWLDTNPVLEPEGRDALAHNLESYSMQLQRLAQRVDNR